MELTAFNYVPYVTELPDDSLSAETEGSFGYRTLIRHRDRCPFPGKCGVTEVEVASLWEEDIHGQAPGSVRAFDVRTLPRRSEGAKTRGFTLKRPTVFASETAKSVRCRPRSWRMGDLGPRLVLWLACIGVPLVHTDAALSQDTDRVNRLQGVMEKLLPLHTKLGKPRPGDRLDVHAEPGQTFREYLRSNPAVPHGKRRTIYIQPLGDFTDSQRRIITLTAEFMECYFGLPVKTKDDLQLSMIPAKAHRRHPDWGMEQILTTYVLDEILQPRLPDDAAACIALTASDLWPGKGWNFVFGQASIAERVGVWSIYRNGDPHQNDRSFRLCLLRTLKTATHEMGHLFSMQHCTKYECNMCGSNHREESDRRPLALCPECVAKVCWATAANPLKRYKKLAAFSKEQGLSSEAAFYEKSVAALDSLPSTSPD